jgi:hypothetical protein
MEVFQKYNKLGNKACNKARNKARNKACNKAPNKATKLVEIRKSSQQAHACLQQMFVFEFVFYNKVIYTLAILTYKSGSQ